MSLRADGGTRTRCDRLTRPAPSLFGVVGARRPRERATAVRVEFGSTRLSTHPRPTRPRGGTGKRSTRQRRRWRLVRTAGVDPATSRPQSGRATSCATSSGRQPHSRAGAPGSPRAGGRRLGGRGVCPVGRAWSHGDSNPEPSACKAAALPVAPWPRAGLRRHGLLPPSLAAGLEPASICPGGQAHIPCASSHEVEPRRARHLLVRSTGCSPIDFGPFERHGSASWPGSCARLAPLPLRRGLSLEVPMCGTCPPAEGEGVEPSWLSHRTAFEAGPFGLSGNPPSPGRPGSCPSPDSNREIPALNWTPLPVGPEGQGALARGRAGALVGRGDLDAAWLPVPPRGRRPGATARRYGSWSHRRVSNPGPRPYQGRALPLSYGGMFRALWRPSCGAGAPRAPGGSRTRDRPLTRRKLFH